jgi:hypothetical protein
MVDLPALEIATAKEIREFLDSAIDNRKRKEMENWVSLNSVIVRDREVAERMKLIEEYIQEISRWQHPEDVKAAIMDCREDLIKIRVLLGVV